MLHALYLLLQALAQELRGQRALCRHLQARQRRAQLVGEIAEQLALQHHVLVESLGHMVERPPQIAQLVAAPADLCLRTRRQVVAAQGIGLRSQASQRHYPAPIQQHSQQQGQPGRHQAMGDQALGRRQAGRDELGGKTQDHPALLRMFGEAQADERPRQRAGAHRPVDAPQESQALGFLRGERTTAQRLQPSVEHDHPVQRPLARLGQPTVDALAAIVEPGTFGSPRIIRQGGAGSGGQVVTLQFGTASPGPGQPYR